ncbi:MAG: sel1 repeat family protein, partial [Opitutales bacterium]|nr:sel1 repeat family protein [Opitutales bacterium]
DLLTASRILEYVWYDDVFENFNRAISISRRHRDGRYKDDGFLSHYRDDLSLSLKLLKAGYFQRAAENSFESLLFMRAWDESCAERDAFLRSDSKRESWLAELQKNPETSATKEDKELLTAFRKHMEAAVGRASRMPDPEKGDPDVPEYPDGHGYFRAAPWVTEITAQLEPVLAKEDIHAWKDFLGEGEVEKLSEIKTKRDILFQMDLARWKELLLRTVIVRDNERSYFLEVASVIPQIQGNENLLKSPDFYHTASTTVYESLKSGYGDAWGNDRQLHRFGYSSYTSAQQFDAVRKGEKEADPKYNALARIITDCRLLALGAALQIKYGPDIGRVENDSVWVSTYENTHFLNALIRTARAQALANIKKCRDKNVPCPAALSAFVEADTSRGSHSRDQLFDVLANYWVASNIAQALDLCFDAQPALADSAATGNADALFLLGLHEGLFGDIKKAEEFLRKSAEQGDARAQYWLAGILEHNGDKKAALSWMEKSAKQNYVPALERLAWRYWAGEEGVVAQDRKKAFSLFKTAAYLGSSNAQERLAWCYINEENVVKEDIPRGRIWRWLAAERDDGFAQIRLANYYRQAAKKNPDRWFDAFRWFSRAAEQGHAQAAADLGDCYWFGRGTEKDPKLAAEWFKKSAEDGNEYGQYKYGFCLYNGKGVEKNREEGLKWLRKAVENGSENAKKYLEELEGNGAGSESEASSPSASTADDDSLLTVSLGDNVSMT